MIWFIVGALVGAAVASGGDERSSNRRRLPQGRDVEDAEYQVLETGAETRGLAIEHRNGYTVVDHRRCLPESGPPLSARYAALEPLRFTDELSWFREVAKDKQLYDMAVECLRRETALKGALASTRPPAAPQPHKAGQVQVRSWELMAREIDEIKRKIDDSDLREELIQLVKRKYLEGES